MAIVRTLRVPLWHTRHWSKENNEGHCLLCPGSNVPGTLEHMLVGCPALEDKRVLLKNFWMQPTQSSLQLQKLLETIQSFSSTVSLVQFLLDPSVIPAVIAGCQKSLYTLDDVFTLTRTFCYGLHRRRLQLNGRFNSRT